jgi:hypothetical protein
VCQRVDYTEAEVAQIKLSNRTGELARAASRLGEAGININYLWFAKTPAEAQNGAVLDGVSLNTIIDPIPQEDSGGHEPECVEGIYI